MKIIIFILCIYSFLFADDDYYEHKDSHSHYYSKDMSYLNLTQIQKKEIKKALHEYREELEDFRKLKRDITKKKKELFSKGLLSLENLKRLNTKHIEKATNIEFNFLYSIENILTPEQKKRFQHYIDEWEVE